MAAALTAMDQDKISIWMIHRPCAALAAGLDCAVPARAPEILTEYQANHSAIPANREAIPRAQSIGSLRLWERYLRLVRMTRDCVSYSWHSRHTA